MGSAAAEVAIVATHDAARTATFVLMLGTYHDTSPAMRTFFCTMIYDVSPDTPADARKLLRAELVGRRWHDRVRNRLMPRAGVWIDRKVDDKDTTDSVHTKCAQDLKDAAAAVAKTGRTCTIARVWIQVAGGGTYGLVAEDFFD